MRRVLLYVITCLTLSYAIAWFQLDKANTPSSEKPALQVLFIGNSYTFFNELPTLLATLSTSANSPRRIQTQMVAEPGATLQVLWNNAIAAKTIESQKWDFVILQEQSALPTLYPELMNDYAKRFDQVIKGKGAKTILFVTWAYKGKRHMQSELNHAYLDVANKLNATVAPVGQAWAIALANNPGLQLHMDENSHPTVLGSYLAACVFYQVILGNQAVCPVLERKDISNEEAEQARNAAAAAVAKISGAKK